MPRLEYFLVAESVSTDADSRQLSIFKVLNEYRFDTEVDSIPTAVFVSCWVSTDEEIAREHQSQVRYNICVTGDRENQQGKDFRSNFTSESRHYNALLRIRGIPIFGTGEIVIKVFLDDVEAATHTIFLIDDR